MRNLPVLSIYYRHKPGGLTKRLYRAYRAIASSGHKLIYISTEELPVKGENIEPVILNMRFGTGSVFYWPEFYLRSVIKLRQLSKEHKAHTHLVFGFFYSTVSILAKVGLPVSTITFVRGDDAFDAQFKSFAPLRMLVHRLLERIGMKYSARVLATNAFMCRNIAGRAGYAEKIECLPNDITTQKLSIKPPSKHEVVNFTTVSVINERKNIRIVLEALARIKHLDWEYHMIGPDTSGKDYLNELKALARDKGIEERVHFLGWREPEMVSSILQDCHLFILPTLSEGSPNSLLEAMGYGLPCLASDVPEVREVLDSPELTFDPYDAAALADKLTRFIQSPHHTAIIMRKTRENESRYRFDWDQRIVDLVSTDEYNSCSSFSRFKR